MTDGWMDDGRTEGRMHGKIILLLHTLTIRGSDEASFVEFRPSGLRGDSMTDRWTDDGRMDAWKINVALAQPYHEEK